MSEGVVITFHHTSEDVLEKAGVRPERLQLEWISAAEGQKFAKVMRQMEELRQTVTEVIKWRYFVHWTSLTKQQPFYWL